ncbi:MAG TPA: sigma-70 family RNA polymerase sigma factor [Candidatus Polarisedimenticolia bacterium]|nr:sigma-70 family RNA polymerase sigma factor [Candidatus Polarisedimenticolia bacterium]
MDATETDPLPEQALVAGSTAESGGGEVSEEITALVRRAQAGEVEAFEALIRMYEGRVIALGMQMGLTRDDALDACQETFIKVFRYIGRFETGRSFFKWLYRIAIHAIYDQMRQNRAVATVSLDELETQAVHPRDESPSAHALAEAQQIGRKVRESLRMLSPRERIVFVLRDLQELGTDEIGGILRLSQITVRRHCMSARQKLRNVFFPDQG